MPGNETSRRTWRIAFLRRRFSPTGGGERYLLRLASGLAAQAGRGRHRAEHDGVGLREFHVR